MNFEKKLAAMEEEKARKKLVGASIARFPAQPLIDSVTLTTPSKYKLGLGGDIDVIVELNQPVIVTGKPTLIIQLYPGEIRTAEYESGSGSRELLFRYTVNEDDASTGISVPAGEIDVPNGSTIKGTTGKHANLQHPSAATPSPPLQVTDEFDERKVSSVVGDLSRSNLPTLIVEGGTDRQIYQWMAKLLDPTSKFVIDLCLADGKPNLLEIYTRRETFCSLPVAFMANLDHCVLGVLKDSSSIYNILREYKDIIWTTGYSIENDLHTDGHPTNLIPVESLPKYKERLQQKIRKFASEHVNWLGTVVTVANPESLRNRCEASISANASLKLKKEDLFDVLSTFYPFNFHDDISDLRFYQRLIETVRGHRPLITRLISEIRDEINRKTQALPPARRRQLISIGFE